MKNKFLNRLVLLPLKYLQSCLLLGIFLCIHCISNAQSSIKFTHLSNRDGLSQSTVQTILKDKYGFIWFGTQDGLNRYDGYTFKVYKHQPKDSTSLRRSDILSLYEDLKGDLWVGTNNGGLSLYDRKRDCFIHYKETIGNTQGLSQKSITAIFEDSRNNFWIGTYWKLNLLNRKTGKVTQFEYSEADTSSISNNGITSIFEDNAKHLWVGTVDGLNLLDQATGKFKRFKHTGVANSLSNNHIVSIRQDKQGQLWVGTDEGLNLYNPATADFTVFKIDNANPLAITNNSIQAIEDAGNGKIWVGTGNSLELFDPKKNIFTHFQSSNRDGASLALNANITSMLRDRDGILWVGTYQGGINKYDPQLPYFDIYRNDPTDYQSLSFNIITCLAEAPDGDIWVGTGGGGLNRWKPATDKFIRYNPDPLNENSLKNWGVLSIVQSKMNKYLWIGMYGYCVDRFDPVNNTFKHFSKGELPTQLNNDAVYAILEDSKGSIWMGTNGGGANVLDPLTGIISKYVTDPNDPGTIAGNFVRSLCEDRKGNIWVGTTTGISVFDTLSKTFTRYDQNNANWESDVIFSIYADKNNNKWIGSQNGGLYRIDNKTNKIKVFTIANGLPDNTINSILEDENGSFWLSTNYGISHFNPVTGAFKNYGIHNGIQSFEFSRGAALITRQGQLALGGINGLNAFYPSHLKENRNIPPVLLTGLRIMNKPVTVTDEDSPLKEDITSAKKVVLYYTKSFITIEFAALGFTSPESNQYAFMLTGFDEKWNYVNAQRTATYTNLDPGTYTFMVKAANNDGVWNEHATTLIIVITPPFWLTWWFRTLIIVTMLGSAWWYYRIRVNALMRHEELLQEKVDQQTIKLLHSTREENKARKWAETANKELELKNKDLEQFAYVASHDLQEPLRTISGFVQLLGQQYIGKLDVKADKYLVFISEASERMQVLIKDLLDISRIGKNVESKQVDCNQIIKAVLSDIQVAILESNAVVNCEVLPVVVGYPTEIKMLFQNLVLNAIKFRKPGVSPRVHISSEKVGSHWQFALRDNGIGIEQQHCERIFDIFQRLHTRKEYPGSGIGLAHCKKIVDMHHGRIWVDAIPGEGCTFYFTLAILDAAEQDD
ncbi:MAG: two-component regulator propeller domain-containing protein [Ferruginibacter sp.]